MPFTNHQKVASWYMAAAIEGTKHLNAAEDVRLSKQHATRLRMVRRILSDEGKSDASIGEAMLTFYNWLAGSHSAPAWGANKYVWLLPAFFTAAAQFPDGFGAMEDLLPLQQQKEEEVKCKQEKAAAEQRAKEAMLAEECAVQQQDVAEKEAKTGGLKRKPARTQTSARPQQLWRKGINL
eukprot:707402-Rhodomonas_salina.1